MDEWKQVVDGAPLRYDAKVGRYVPYTPDEYSEYKLGPSDVAPPFYVHGHSRKTMEQGLIAVVKEITAAGLMSSLCLTKHLRSNQ